MTTISGIETMARKAISYTRFSGKKQEFGESKRRQDELALRAAEEEKLPLDTTLSLHDKGISAFRGKNWKSGKLGKFIDLVDAGIVPRGSVLIIERVNRMSRAPWMVQVEQWKEILSRGIVIRTCEPPARYHEGNMNDLGVGCPVVMYMMLGHIESKQKSDWSFDASDARKKRTRETNAPHGLKCPSWLETIRVPHPHHPEKEIVIEYRLPDDRKRLIRWIHEQSQKGHGLDSLIAEIEKKGFRAWGWSGKWSRFLVRTILSSRNVIGEYQPTKLNTEGLRVPDGDPIPNHYPAAINEECFNRTQAARRSRRGKGGRHGESYTNLFTHIVKDACDGDAVFCIDSRLYVDGKLEKQYHYLTIRSLPWRIPMSSFERVVLSTISQLRSKDVDGSHESDALTSRVESLQQKLCELNLDLASIDQQLHELPSAKWPKLAVARMSELEDDIKVTKEDLRMTKESANTSTRIESLHDLKSALRRLDEVRGTKDETLVRQRIRTRLPFIVESIWLRLQSETHRSRYVHVRIYLHGGEQRYFYLTFGKPKQPPLPLADADFRAGECRNYAAKAVAGKSKRKPVAF